MLGRYYNMVLASLLTLIPLVAMIGNHDFWDMIVWLHLVIGALWLSGAIALAYGETHWAYYSSLVGICTLLTESFGAILWAVAQIGYGVADDRSGAGYVLIAGSGGITLSMPALAWLLHVRRICLDTITRKPNKSLQ